MKTITKIFLSIILLVCLGIASTAYGQNGIHAGITGGLNSSQIESHWGQGARLWKFNAGLAFSKPLPGNFSLSSELVYSREGNRSRPGTDTRQFTHFDYISLPTMFRFRPGGKALFIQAGGKFSYLINHKVNYTDPSNDITRTSTVNHLRQWDAGAISGLGVWLGSHVTVDLRYYHGLAPMIKKHWVLDHTLEPVFYGADRWLNRVWSLNMTIYLFEP